MILGGLAIALRAARRLAVYGDWGLGTGDWELISINSYF